MQALWLAIGVIIGTAIVLIAMRPRLRGLSLDAARASELDRELDRARSDLEHERDLAEQRLATVTDAQARMSESFKALSVEALQSNMGQLTELARAQLQAAQTEAKGDLDKRRDQVEQLVAPLKEQLGRVDTQLTKLDHERRASSVRLESQLRSLTESGERLRVETGSLVTALRKPNTRGQWGQMQLRNVVEAAGMLRHCDFTEQVSYPGEDATLRPDMVVNLPGGKTVIVDAKAPLQGLLDAYEARDETEREAHLRDHARLLRRHVKQLGDKAYWSRLDSTPDMVVMFLPGESLIGPALDADPDLLGDAMAQRVLIATPTTLLALLHAVGYGWQQERVAESAQAVSELGRELHTRLVRLSTTLASLGKRLNGAVTAYNETIGSYEARVLPSARKFAEHGAVAEGTEIPALEPVASTARTVQAGVDLRLDVGTGRVDDQVGDRQVGDRNSQASHSDRDPRASNSDLDVAPPRRLRPTG
jgi:DNA recombination protein RmuC